MLLVFTNQQSSIEKKRRDYLLTLFRIKHTKSSTRHEVVTFNAQQIQTNTETILSTQKQFFFPLANLITPKN